MKSKIVLIGAPGAGKGTQAKLIEEKYNIPHISTGDIFRENMRKKTPIGLKALEYIDKGALVPDEVTVEIVADRLKSDDCRKGFILDGFPRTLNQAEALCKLTDIDVVINIVADPEKIIQRLSGRRVCPKCGESFHVSFKKDNICDKCGGTLIIRDDDRVEVIENRLKVFDEQTKPIIEFFRGKGLVADIDGMESVENVFGSICEAVEK